MLEERIAELHSQMAALTKVMEAQTEAIALLTAKLGTDEIPVPTVHPETERSAVAATGREQGTVAESAAESAPVEAAPAIEQAAPKAVTIDDVRDALIAYKSRTSREETLELLKRFVAEGAPLTVGNIATDRYADVVAATEEVPF